MKKNKSNTKKKKRIWIPFAAVFGPFLLMVLYSFIWTLFYYRPDSVAMEAMKSDDKVTVSETDYGCFFDGPSEDTAMIFYPGAKVEEILKLIQQ